MIDTEVNRHNNRFMERNAWHIALSNHLAEIKYSLMHKTSHTHVSKSYLIFISHFISYLYCSMKCHFTTRIDKVKNIRIKYEMKRPSPPLNAF